MVRHAINDNEYHSAVKGFSHAVKVKAEGTFLFVSGLLAERRLEDQDYPWYESVLHEDDAFVTGTGNIEEQTRSVLKSLSRILRIEGGSLDDVVRIVIYLVDMEDYPIVHRVRSEFFGEEPPASTCVQVSRLYDTRQLIEIEATALIP